MTKITKTPFGEYNGKQIELFTLDNGTTQVSVMTLGATLVSIKTPDENGKVDDVLLGYDTPTEYMSHGGYLGAIIGRHSNRIKNAEFTLNGTEYKICANEGTNNLHGGPNGYDVRVWDITAQGDKLICKLYDEDMSAKFPGNVEVTVTYTLSDDNALKLEYKAVSDKDTIVNLTNHAYFNLNGHTSGTIVNHKMKIYADFYTPVDTDCCPTGEVLSVAGTVFDFREFKTIGDEIDKVPDFKTTSGYDHNFVLKTAEKKLTLAAEVLADKCARRLTVYTDKPAIQFYAGNCMDEVAGKGGHQYKKRDGFCLETQYFPNSLANPHFPSPILRKGEEYNFTTVYKFDTVK